MLLAAYNFNLCDLLLGTVSGEKVPPVCKPVCHRFGRTEICTGSVPKALRRAQGPIFRLKRLHGIAALVHHNVQRKAGSPNPVPFCGQLFDQLL